MPDERTTLEARLVDLGAAIAFPVTPPTAALVGDRLRQTPRRSWGRPLGRSMALALVATLLLAAIAAAFGIGLGGLRLVFGPPSFSPAPSMLVGPELGQSVSASQARASVTFDLRVPSLATLAEPDRVYFAQPPDGGVVTLLYGERAGFPADATTGIGLIITQFRADIGPGVFEKLIVSGVSVTPVKVRGQDAWWVAGGDHFFFYRDAQGRVVDSTMRLASDTLIWEEGIVTHRVEGAPSLADAIRVAESLE